MDHLSNGRFVLGLGVSGPQVVEGWYGQPFPKPLARTREYVVDHPSGARPRGPRRPTPGRTTRSPTPAALGLGKPLKPITHPLRADVPIILGAEGPKNVALAAEIADGWFPLFFSARHEHLYADALQEGFGRAGARRSAADFEVLPTVTVIIDDDVEAAADTLRPVLALYVAGWARAT